jgi:hypothetical protein
MRPTITLQPISQHFLVDASVSLIVEATPAVIGHTLTYQWYKDSAVLTGATAATLTINPAGETDDGSYVCRVTDAAETTDTYADSAAAVLSVDCIVAAITRNRKAALSAISKVSGYLFTPDAVEEPRLVRSVNDRYPYMQITLAPIEPEAESNNSDQIPLYYLVTYEDQYNDDAATDDEIIHHFRNVTADIVRAWTLDRTCGGYAEYTRRTWEDSAVVQEESGVLYRAALIFEVQALIDSNNPFKRG